MSQRGSTRRRGETWTAYWFVRDVDGERRQRTKGGFRTKGDAQRHLTTVLSAVNDGTWSEPADKKITVKAYLEDHWLPAARTDATRSGEPPRPTTIATYEIAVRSWIVPHIGGERLVSLTPRHVEQMLAALLTGGGRKGQALGRAAQVAHRVLRQALDHAVRRGFVPRNVAADVRRPGVRAREMSAWTAEEAQTFLAAVTTDRLYAAWLLLLARGPRRGELAGLRWSEVDLDAGRLRVTRTRVVAGRLVVDSTPKTQAGRRTIPLDAGLVKVLRAHRERQLFEARTWGAAYSDLGYVFAREDGQPLRPESISQRFERLCRRVGVRAIRLHDLRHTAASLMLEDGTPVKVAAEMLGHSNPNVTQAIYQHVLPGMAEQAGQRLSGRLLGVN